MTQTRDILIVGAGLAGLFLALKLAPRRCTVIALAPLGQAAASAWAQGGMAAALSPEDQPSLHASDTVAAGAGIVDPVVAQLIAQDGPQRIRDLLELGVPFDRTADGRILTPRSPHPLDGARIVHLDLGFAQRLARRADGGR